MSPTELRPLTSEEEARLVAAAREAKRRAVAPYSRFRVGAALLCEGGKIVTGCNVESATYGLTVCAERTAVFKALSDGVGGFRAVAVATDADTPTPPCGACRQVMWDQCRDIAVVMSAGGAVLRRHLSELFPQPFEFGGPPR
jgi:cytidine deaminase